MFGITDGQKFTTSPKKATLNYSYLDENIDPYDLCPRISSFDEGNFSDPIYEDTVNSIVPVTQGLRVKKYFDTCLVMILPGYSEVAEQMMPIINQHEQVFFIKTKAVKAMDDQIKSLFTDMKVYNSVVNQKVKWGKDDFTFIQFGGFNVEETITGVLKNIFVSGANSYYTWKDMKASQEVVKTVFESWKEETGFEINKK